MRISVFRRRRSAVEPYPALLQAYLARAQAIMDAGGGNLWLIEPTLSPDVMPAFAEAVARHLAEHGVVTGEIAVLPGSTSARIVLPATPTIEIVMPDERVSPPATPSGRR